MNIDQLSKARLRTGETSYVYGKGGAHHSYSYEERRSFVDYINFVLRDDPDLKHLIPIDKESDQIFKDVQSGLLLCKFVNALAPGSIDDSKIIRKQSANKYEMLSNINLAINGGSKMGCNFVNINTEDIYEGKPHIVLGFFWNVIRVSLLNKVNLNRHPELINILQKDEDVSSITDDNPEKVLLKWFNFHLKNAQHPRVVNNFKSDISDGENYLVLLEQIAAGRVPNNLHLEKDPRKRAELVCKTAESLDALKFINPEDILRGNEKLNLAFTAYLFNKYPGLGNEEIRKKEEEMRRLKFEEEQRLKEERLRQEEEKLAEYQRLINEENKLKLEKLKLESEQQRRLIEEKEQELKLREEYIKKFEEGRKFRELELQEQEELQKMKVQQMREMEEQQRLREENIRRMEEQQKLREEQLRLEEEEQMRMNEESMKSFQSQQQSQQQFQQQQYQQQTQQQQPLFTQYSQYNQDRNMYSQYQSGFGQSTTATHFQNNSMFATNMGTFVVPPIPPPLPQRVVLTSVTPQVSAYSITTVTSPPPPPPPPPTMRVIVTRTTTIRRRF